MKTTGFIPLSQALHYWPEHLLGKPEFLDKAGIREFDVHPSEGGDTLSVSGTLAWYSEMTMDIPGLDGFSVALLSGNGFTDVPFRLDLRPDFALTLEGLSMAFRFDTGLLRPVEERDGRWEILRGPDGRPRPAQVTLDGVSVTADIDGNLEFDATPTLRLGAVQIGDTGLVLEIGEVTPYFSRNQDPPEGAPAGFRGFTVESASVHLPEGFGGNLVPELRFEGLVIGTGGFSGRIRGAWCDDEAAVYDTEAKAFDGGAGTLFGIPFALRSIELDFVQNAPTHTAIRGDLLLPFFEEPVAVDIGIGFDGRLTVGISRAETGGDDAGLLTLEKEGVLSLTLDSLGFELEDGVFQVRLNGEITPLFGTISGEDPNAGALDWPSFQVDELVIDSRGNVRLEGGWLDLDDQHVLDFYGFQFEITGLGFGKEDDGGKWVGFSGSLKLVDGLQAGASVEGLRVTWYGDGRAPGLSFNGIGVEFAVPDVLDFKGTVSYRRLPGGGHRLDGAVKLHLVSLDLYVDGMLVIGRASAEGEGTYPFFAVFLNAALPSGIPLWATGLGLYGMAGLFALQMEPGREGDEAWYGMEQNRSWYHRGKPGVTDLTNKWKPRQDSLAVGAGVTLGTLADNGFAFSGRMLLVIVFPGPVLLLEGRGDLVKKRGESGAEEEPLFRALIVLDNREETLTAGLDARYRYGDGGELLDIGGSAEAFFDFRDPGAWRLHVGQDEPRERRFRAGLFRLFEANAYFMMDAKQLSMGAWAGYENSWTFRPVDVNLAAWMDGNAVVSWTPAHFHGALWMHANVEISVFRFGAGLTADARLQADIFQPFEILGEFSLRLDTPWPLPDVEVDLTLRWGPQQQVAPPLPVPLKEAAVEHGKVATTWPLAPGAMLRPDYDRGDGFLAPGALPGATAGPAEDAMPVVPLDSLIALTFTRPVNDDAQAGSAGRTDEWERIGDPENGKGPLLVRYGLSDLVLERRSGTGREEEAWETVAAAEAGSWDTGAGQPAAGNGVGGVKRLYGAWAPLPDPANGSVAAADGKRTKLLLWARTPFDYARNTGGAWADWLTEEFPEYPCPLYPAGEEVCCDFEHVAPEPEHGCEGDKHGQEARFPLTCRADERIVIHPPDGPSQPSYSFQEHPGPDGETRRMLCIDGYAILHILFTQPAESVRITLGEGGPVRAFAADKGQYPGPDKWDGPYLPVDGVMAIDRANTGTVAIEVAEGPRCLVEICVTFAPKPGEVERYHARLHRLQEQIAEFSGAGHVLEPHTVYRLKVNTSVEAEVDATGPLTAADNPLAAAGNPLIIEQYAYFRTEGPPGLTNLSLPGGEEVSPGTNGEGPPSLQDIVALQGDTGALVGVDGEPSGRPVLNSSLNDLDLYVSQTVPATVPGRGEKPVLARPFYRAYDVGIEFNENYVDLMYRLARRGLHLYLYDRNDRPVRDSEGRLVILSNRWGRLDELRLGPPDLDWADAVQNSACADIDAETVLHRNIMASVQVLDPDTIYEARLIPLLLHEDFAGHAPGVGVAPWTVHNDTTSSAWRIVEDPETGTRCAAETSGNGGGSSDPRDPVKPGTLLLYGNDPQLPGSHPDQPANWTDYRLNAYVRLSPGGNEAPGSGMAGVIFRYKGPEEYYRLSLDPRHGIRRLVRLFGGRHTVLAEDSAALSGGRDYLVTVEAAGSAIRIYQDNALVFEVCDDSLPRGAVGLYSWRNPDARFAEVFVDDYRKRAPVLYRFEFGTSRFTNFFHHLHSFQDETWPLNLPGEIDRTTRVDWMSSDEFVATVDAFGRVTGVAPGRAYIVAQLGGAVAAAPVVVAGFEEGALLSFDVTPGEENISPGDTMQVSAVFAHDDEEHDLTEEVEWTTGDASVAVIDEHGIVTGIDHGVARIHAELLGLQASARVIVGAAEPVPELIGLTVSLADEIIGPQGSTRATAAGAYDDGSTGDAAGIEWSSSNEAVATINENGQVTAHGIGFALITAAAGEISFTAPVFVANPAGEETGLAVHLAAEELEPEEETRATATVPYPGGALNLAGGLAAAVIPTTLPAEVSETEANAYDALARRPLLEAARGEAASHVQVTRVDGAGAFALLVRSPEPFDWSRTTLDVLFAPGKRSHRAKEPGAVKLTGASFSGQAAGEEHVELLLREALNPSRYRIEYRNYPGAVAEPGGDPYLLEVEFDERAGHALFQETLGPNTLDRYAIVDEGARRGPSEWMVSGDAIVQTCLDNGGTRCAGSFTIEDEDPIKARSAWSVSAGSLVQAGGGLTGHASDAGTQAVAGELNWNDYRVSTGLQGDDGKAVGAVFRYRDCNNYYRLTLDSRKYRRRLVCLQDGAATELWSENAGYPAGRPMVLILDAVGPRLTGYLDGVRMFSLEDHAHSAGRAGVYAQVSGTARFSSFRVSRPPPDACTLFTDAFIDDDLKGWKFVDEGTAGGQSEWSTRRGTLRQTGGAHSLPDDPNEVAGPGAFALTGNPDWTDIVVSARVQAAVDGAVGLLFRYADTRNYYRFSMDSRGCRRLVRNAAGAFTVLWEDDEGPATGRFYHLEIACTGGVIRGYLDGVPMFAVEDDAVLSGQVGLYCRHCTDARFSNVRVHPVDHAFTGWLFEDASGNVPGDGWTLPGGKDGIIALAGEGDWTDYRIHTRLRVKKAGVAGVVARYRDADHHYRLTVDAGSGRWRFLKKVAGSLHVLRETTRPLTAGRDYLVALECDGDLFTAWLDGAVLFTVQDVDVTAGQVGLYCEADATFVEFRVAPPVWSLYYRFVGEKTLAAGTRLFVHGCRLQDAPPAPYGNGRRCAATAGESGRARLTRHDAELRVCAPDAASGDFHRGANGTQDAICHLRRFRPDDDYRPAGEFRFLRKGDGTGLFLLAQDGTGRSLLAHSEYRLKFLFRRDKRRNGYGSGTSLPQADVYTQAGDGSDELVMLDVPQPVGAEDYPALAGIVNVNTAGFKRLQDIIHIGPNRAQQIIDLLLIKSLDDLTRVSGIGPIRLQDIKDQGKAYVSKS